ncbi:MAG TPA: CYTH domain-containing protein [Candidatus Saccharimonadia bacterium]|nr:CYTH domain-containing protein [Candidatus Saccharimonadia bacterium]
MDTHEVEYKVLDVNPESVAYAMKAIGAKQVYDDIRIITYFDHPDRALKNAGEGIKLTEEGKLKLEYTRKATNGQSDTVKLFVSRKAEAVEFLKRLDLTPVTQVEARRISYELGPIDFDIDCFPGIAPFMEVDLADSGEDLKELLGKLGVGESEVIVASTPEIFSRSGKDYFIDFAIQQ